MLPFSVCSALTAAPLAIKTILQGASHSDIITVSRYPHPVAHQTPAERSCTSKADSLMIHFGHIFANVQPSSTSRWACILPSWSRASSAPFIPGLKILRASTHLLDLFNLSTSPSFPIATLLLLTILPTVEVASFIKLRTLEPSSSSFLSLFLLGGRICWHHECEARAFVED